MTSVLLCNLRRGLEVWSNILATNVKPKIIFKTDRLV
jgi:hypothetical protein